MVTANQVSQEKHPVNAHRYRRRRLGKKGYVVYACTFTGCAHYIRRELAEGKLNICHCGTIHKLTKNDLRKAKPHCKRCTKKVGFALTKGTAVRDIDDSPSDAILQETDRKVQPPSSVDFSDLLPKIPKP